MSFTGLVRSVLLLVIVVLIPACGSGGGGGGGAPPPIVLLSDDFSGTLSNWTADGKAVLNAGAGNPAPSVSATGATTAANFNFSSGLTVKWDFYFPLPYPGGATLWGGVNSGTPAAPGFGAGIGVGPSTINWQCYLNGAVVFMAAFAPPQPSWSNLEVKILPNGTVQYFVNASMIYQSVGTVSFTSPRGVLLGSAFGGIGADNVVVTVP